MEKTLAVINALEERGLIGRYAIGGAMAATRYIEPIQTYDLDVFVLFPETESGLLSLEPVYAYLRSLGYEPEMEAILIEGWPVQFLPVYNALTEEALASAVEVDFGTTPTRVLDAEHLAAIMLDTGRSKDQARLVQFLESGALNLETFERVIGRHQLTAKWDTFRTRFLTGPDGGDGTA